MLNRVSTAVEMEAVLSSSTMHVLYRDYETRSLAILKKVGTYKYAVDSSTTVLCCAFAVDDEPVQLWTPGDPVPAEFIEAATNPSWIVCAQAAAKKIDELVQEPTTASAAPFDITAPRPDDGAAKASSPRT